MSTPWTPAFESQRTEATTTLDVEGDLPSWLAGTYLVNGPGQFEVGGRPLVHWFDPLAMVRRISFEDGRVTYTNRYVESEDYAFAREHGKVRTAFPGTAPDRPVWTRVRQALTGEFPDNPVIGVTRIGGRLLAVTESPVGLELDPETLGVVDRHDLTAGLDADLTLAHAHYAPEESAFYNLGISYGREPAYTLFRRPDEWTDGPAAPTPLTRIRIDRGYVPYVHSFALTERYAVVPVCPFGNDLRQLLTGAFTGGTFLDAFRAFGDDSRFLVLDRATGERVATVAADPFFVYHHANAFEDGDEVVVDCITYPDERAVTGLTLSTLRTGGPDAPSGDLVRFRLPLSGDEAERQHLRSGHVEFPMIHYRRDNGHPYRTLWAAEAEGAPIPTRLSKISVPDGTARSYDPGDHAYPGEAVFVPGPDAPDEPATDPDARRVATPGVLLSIVLDADRGGSDLVVLDAETMAERARAALPHRLPYAFHGQFYAADDPVRSMN